LAAREQRGEAILGEDGRSRENIAADRDALEPTGTPKTNWRVRAQMIADGGLKGTPLLSINVLIFDKSDNLAMRDCS